MNSKPVKIIFYIISGFFIYMVSVLAFIAPDHNVPLAGKIAIMAMFSVPALIALCLGFLAERNGRKLYETGIVLLSSAAFAAFLVLSIISMWASPDFKNQLAKTKIDIVAFFSDYATGFGFMAALALTGLLFLRLGSKTQNTKPVPQT